MRRNARVRCRRGHGGVHACNAVAAHLQDAQLVRDAAQRPRVGLVVIRALAPQLRRHVVGRANLGLGEAPLHELRAAEVAHAHVVRGREQHVLGLDVAVQDVLRVQLLQRRRHLNQVRPDEVLLHEFVRLLVVRDHLQAGGGGGGGTPSSCIHAQTLHALHAHARIPCGCLHFLQTPSRCTSSPSPRTRRSTWVWRARVTRGDMCSAPPPPVTDHPRRTHRIMFGCDMLARMRISLTASSRSRVLSLRMFTSFTAYLQRKQLSIINART